MVPGAWAKERYSQWSAGDEKYDALLKRLNKLTTVAEKSSAADPRLLRELRDAIVSRTVAAPEVEPAPALPPQKLVYDYFDYGDFTRNSVWTLVEGRFSVDSGFILRSIVAKVTPVVKKSTKQPWTELVTDVLGSLLGTKKKIAKPAPNEPECAEKLIQTPITNAFQVVFEIISRENHSRFALGLFQGRSGSAG